METSSKPPSKPLQALTWAATLNSKWDIPNKVAIRSNKWVIHNSRAIRSNPWTIRSRVIPSKAIPSRAILSKATPNSKVIPSSKAIPNSKAVWAAPWAACSIPLPWAALWEVPCWAAC